MKLQKDVKERVEFSQAINNKYHIGSVVHFSACSSMYSICRHALSVYYGPDILLRPETDKKMRKQSPHSRQTTAKLIETEMKNRGKFDVC